MQDERGPGMTTGAVGKAEPKARCFRPRKFSCEQLWASMARVTGNMQEKRWFLLGGHLGCPKSSCAQTLPFESIGSVNRWGDGRPWVH